MFTAFPFFLFGCVIFALTYATKFETNQIINSDSNYTVCKKRVCHNVAKFIINGMNETIDPCEDFYGYVCGNWHNKYSDLKPNSLVNVQEIHSATITRKLKKILEEDITSKDPMALQREKSWYAACMDEERLKERGFDILASIINRIGGWPLVNENTKWNENIYPWQKVAMYFANIFFGYSLFYIGVHPDNDEEKSIIIDQGINHLYRDLDDNIIDTENEKKLLMQVAKAYAKSQGVTREISNQEVEDIMQFKVHLDEILSKYDSKANKARMTFEKLQAFYDEISPGSSTSKIDWLKLINVMSKKSGLKITRKENVTILDKPYIKKLAIILNQTSHRTIVNYIHWTFVKDSLEFLDRDNRKEYFDTIYRLGSVKIDSPRWRYCFDNMPFSEGISIAYIRRYFPIPLRDAVTIMLKEIREEVKREINSSSWMNKDIKMWAIGKIDDLEIYMGYPDYLDNESLLNPIYRNIKISPDYFENYINGQIYTSANIWRELKKPINSDIFAVSPYEIDAAYERNQISITAAQLNVPHFNPKLPMSVNHGYIGNVIAHEIFHSLDSNERVFDKTGNMTSWPEKMSDAYNQRADCFIDQFKKYKANARKTQDENMADTAGLIAAFETYKNKIKKTDMQEKRLPGLEDMNQEKLFFLTFANSFCENVLEDDSYLELDEHASPPLRVNAAVSNSEEFSRVFKCSKNSPMNPAHKCNILK